MRNLTTFAFLLALLGCTTPDGEPRDPQETLENLIRSVGWAAVQVELVPLLQEKAPEAFRLVDKNGDQMLSAEELVTLDLSDPVVAVVIYLTAKKLIR